MATRTPCISPLSRPASCPLHVGIEILHAEANAIEAGVAQRGKLSEFQSARINFNPRFNIDIEREHFVQDVHQFDNFFFR